MRDGLGGIMGSAIGSVFTVEYDEILTSISPNLGLAKYKTNAFEYFSEQILKSTLDFHLTA